MLCSDNVNHLTPNPIETTTEEPIPDIGIDYDQDYNDLLAEVEAEVSDEEMELSLFDGESKNDEGRGKSLLEL